MPNRACSLLLLSLICNAAVSAADEPIHLSNGLSLTPNAVPHAVQLPLNPGLTDRPKFQLGRGVTTLLSPSGNELLVLTSGYNQDGRRSSKNEYVFVYDTSKFPPKQVQALPIPNTFCGLAWNPNGSEFYVSGGVDDTVYVFSRAQAGGAFARAASVTLGHAHGNGLFSNLPAPINEPAPKPMTAGIAVNKSGTMALVANFYNDTISLIDLKTRKKTAELDLRPGVNDPTKKGQPGGEYPLWAAIQGDDTAYISSTRDREIVVVKLGAKPAVSGRIHINGQPNRILLNRAQNKLYAAVDNADAVAEIDTASSRVTRMMSIVAPPSLLSGNNLPKGANPNSLALSPDEKTLYVTDGGLNAVALVSLDAGAVTGMVPTAWYPNSVSISNDGKTMFVVNAKSVPGPNPGNCRGDVKAPKIPDCTKAESGYYVYSLQHSVLMAAPIPQGAELAELTRMVAKNNRFDAIRSTESNAVMAELRKRIKHVIYIVKENRTYDQVLGDLEVGNGDPALNEFPEALTPNHHAFARNFVTLDNFLDSGEVSGVGWNWSTGARTTDYTEKTVPVNYAGRGFVYDWEGTNRLVNVGHGTLEDRMKAQPLLGRYPDYPPDENLLPGEGDVAAPDSDAGEAGTGYIWDEALRAGIGVRNYGFFCDLVRYDGADKNPSYLPISKTPFADKALQAVPTKKALIDRTDVYFRSFDQNDADFYRFREWEREFNQQVNEKNLPGLTLLRFAHDHFGEFKTARYGINTPALMISDNDYAIGMVAEKIANSPYKDDTLIFVIEDDAQDGPDHVDATRSIAFIVGPYVKQHAVVSESYTTVNFVRTMEAVLGMKPSSLYSAVAEPMAQVFDLNQKTWNYKSLVPELLRTSELPLPAATADNSLPPSKRNEQWAHDRHNAQWWQKRIGDMDYEVEDKLDTARFNQVLWKGMMGDRPYPAVRSGKDLSQNREALLGNQ